MANWDDVEGLVFCWLADANASTWSDLAVTRLSLDELTRKDCECGWCRISVRTLQPRFDEKALELSFERAVKSARREPLMLPGAEFDFPPPTSLHNSGWNRVAACRNLQIPLKEFRGPNFAVWCAEWHPHVDPVVPK